MICLQRTCHTVSHCMFIFIIIFSVNFWTCTCISTRLCVVSISWGGFACGSWLNLIYYCFRSLFPAFYLHPIELQVFFSECVSFGVFYVWCILRMHIRICTFRERKKVNVESTLNKNTCLRNQYCFFSFNFLIYLQIWGIIAM